ncbi:MAG TPA: GNAT family N-acetyltransferase [Polyangiaceae bacterium]
MVDSLNIRPRASGDDEFIGELSKTAFADYSRRSGPVTLGFVRAASAHTLVACRGPTPVGFASIDVDGPRASLQAIAVVARERGTGVGARLLAAVEAEARARGAHELRLCTGEANVEALQLFLRAGFRITSRFPRYYTRGQNACEMRKLLTP